jgi:hypothetical protein
LIEFVSRGRFVKVIAIDPVSLIEVCIVGDARESQSRLENIAARKLRYVLLKRFGNDLENRGRKNAGFSQNNSQKRPIPKKRGIIV